MSRHPVLAVVLLVVAAIAFVAYHSTFVVLQSEQALVLQFGDPKRVVNTPGLKFKRPFLENVAFFDKRILALESPSEELITSDQKRLLVDAFARYRITDPLLYYQTLSNDEIARSRLGSLLNSNVRRVLGSQEMLSIVSGERGRLMQQIRDILNAEAGHFGVQIVDVRIKRTDLPEANSLAIFRRMQAERDREAKENRAQGDEIATRIRADADRQRTVILAEAQKTNEILRGEGDAERTRIFAEATSQDPEFYAYYRSLLAYQNAFSGQDTTFVLSPKSDFFRYFNNLPESVERGRAK
ncbi:MAG TPA: protease modulator HflC [Candidatus Cybelea sp.]|nr:protease modulator HflC [Candidatus Cybelea sp.]